MTDVLPNMQGDRNADRWMQNKSPSVTIGLPVYNGEKYIRAAIASILNQTFSSFELIISDNASTDGTEQICKEFAEQDDRIIYRRNPKNIGLTANHNIIFQLCRGKYFKWMGHDDVYLPSMLERCVGIFDSAPSTMAVVYVQYEFIDEFGKPFGLMSDSVSSSSKYPWCRLSRFLTRQCVYNFTQGLIRPELLRKTSLYGLFPMADIVLFAELAMLGELYEIREPLVKYRVHPGASLRAHRTPQALRELFDPTLAGKKFILSLESRVYIELIRSAWRTPQTLLDRIMCFGAALVMLPWWRFRNFGGLWKQRILWEIKRSLRFD